MQLDPSKETFLFPSARACPGQIFKSITRPFTRESNPLVSLLGFTCCGGRRSSGYGHLSIHYYSGELGGGVCFERTQSRQPGCEARRISHDMTSCRLPRQMDGVRASTENTSADHDQVANRNLPFDNTQTAKRIFPNEDRSIFYDGHGS